MVRSCIKWAAHRAMHARWEVFCRREKVETPLPRRASGSFFFFKGKGAYDIAILVMHAKVRFSPNVKPICLPTQEIQDEDRKAFTAGYGLRYVSQKKEDAVLADKLQSSCLTNEIGPSTFKHCQGVEAEIFYFLLQQRLRPPFFTL